MYATTTFNKESSATAMTPHQTNLVKASPDESSNFLNSRTIGGGSVKPSDIKLPTIEEWRPHPTLNRGGPYSALGCGDAWCVVDWTGSLAWRHNGDLSRVFDDKELAEKVAKHWNDVSKEDPSKAD